MLRRLLRQMLSGSGRRAPQARGAPALLAAAVEAQRRGALAEAEVALRAAIAAAPERDEARHLLGALLCRTGRAAEACEILGDVVARAPQSIEARFNLGAALESAGDAAIAREHYRAVLGIAPDFAPARSNLANLLLRSGEFEAAIAEYRLAVAASPGQAELWYNLGNAYMEVTRSGEAIAAYDRALACNPDYADAHFNRALALLRAGQWAAGWPGYEWRFRKTDEPTAWRDFDCPVWDGRSLAGRTLVVWGEQGLGDEIMFASCLPRLLAAGHRVAIECAPQLRALFQRSFAPAPVHARGELTAGRDDAFHVPIGSLPLRSGAGAGPPFAPGGYLQADPERVARWRERLAGLGSGLKVGISWRGGTAATRTSRRSIELERWLPVLRVPGARFVSLQYTREYDALAAFSRTHDVGVTAWPEAIESFEETAALMAALDLVISVCNTAVHLGGALGRPVWVMAPHSAEWRYGVSGEAMSWYPSVTMLRQGAPGDWEPVIATAAAKLRALAAGAGQQTERA